MKKILAASLLLLILCSCKRNTANPVGPVGVLKSFSLKEYSGGTTVATDNIATFYYDNQQRVAQIVSVAIDSTNSPVTNDTSIFNFSYSGSSKYAATYTDQEGVYLAFHTVSYDAQSRPVLDSITNIVPAYVRSNDYTASHKHTLYSGNMNIGLFTYYENHIVFEIDSITINNQNPVIFNLTEFPTLVNLTTTYTYGASLDPLYALNVSPIITLAKFSGRNLPLTETLNFGSTVSGNFTYEYVFNENGQLTQSSGYSGTLLLTSTTYQYQ